jgi:hypothetical protein
LVKLGSHSGEKFGIEYLLFNEDESDDGLDEGLGEEEFDLTIPGMIILRSSGNGILRLQYKLHRSN